jgi:putative heme-binding domain-containing protein
VVIGALASGWPAASPPKLSDAQSAELAGLMKALAPEARDRLLQLVDKWGRRDLFAQELAAAAKELRAAVENASLDAAKRSDAAKRLLSLEDTPGSIEAVLNQVTPLTAPDVQAGLLEALSASRSPAVGEAIVGRWGNFTPAGQKAALELLLRRVTWTTALLAGVKAGTINSADLARQHWQNLTRHPDGAIARQAQELEKSTGRALTAERKDLVDKLMPLADKQGDLARGKLAYEKNCMVCHTLEGQGGKVGPDLTGVGARPRSDILIEMLDPNRSVEGTYRQWTVKTRDDNVISGRLLAESRTSVEIIDAAGMRHVLSREDIQSLRASNLSVMPEGFELLPPEDLTGIIEYLGTSKVKH